jgi:xylulose-5-phosphate/fructose-6-phosphate phosphoketolase
MPGEVIDRPNPQALASHIPDEVLSLSVKLEKAKLNDADLQGLEEFRRAANYIAAGKFSHSKIQKSRPNSDSHDLLVG